jgi:two-component system response regulator MprA
MDPKRTILVIEDEPHIVLGLKDALEFEGFAVLTAPNGRIGMQLAQKERPDAILLDLMLPDLNGYQVCEDVRRTNQFVPIIMLTAKSQEADKIRGLQAGADDYVTKPFALEELLARVRALLRRTIEGDDGEVLRFADLELDPSTREVRRGDRPMELTRTEFSLLELFLRNPRQVLTRSVIFERVWGYDFGFGSNSLDVYIGYLRRKTEAGGEPRLIHTVRGVGYALREQ